MTGMLPVRLQTLRLSSVSRIDMHRLRGLPLHPVHAAAMDTMHRYAEGRIMLARPLDTDDIRAYLVFHAINPATVMVDYLYSPFGGDGTASRLLDSFEDSHRGKTAVLMTTVAAMKFYENRGYRVNTHYLFSKDL